MRCKSRAKHGVCLVGDSAEGPIFVVNEMYLFACFLLFLCWLRLQKSLQNEEK